jgi:hypothetical protein
MKIRNTIALMLLMGMFSSAAKGGTSPGQPSPQPQAAAPAKQGPTAGADSASSPKVDPAKAADIRKLMDLMGSAAAVNQVISQMEKSIKPLMTSALPPGDYRDKLVDLFFEKFHARLDVQQLLDQAIPVYDKYLSEDDIKGLIQFYSTPLGEKTAHVLPMISAEMQAAGGKWGQDLGRQCMLEVLSEHPELAKAMEDAQKSAKPQ